MDAVPPYAPSFRWYACWYGCKLRGMPDEEAVARANRISGVSGKEFARCRVRSANGGISLSVAVEGGSSGLKRRGGSGRASVSLHGRWPHVHIGALDAAYGRYPYYQHIMPGIRDILEKTLAGDSLTELNDKIHKILSGFLATDIDETAKNMAAVRMRGLELAGNIDAELSLIDALMYYGPETSLALLCYNDENF